MIAARLALPRRAAAALLACAVALAGCGLGPGKERTGGAVLRVTRDFGHVRVGSTRVEKIREGETAMRLLRSKFQVGTRYGGRFVQSIEGLAGRGAGGREDWFYFVNGIEAGVGAADYELSPGDVIRWDYRSWAATMRVPAIVGDFPEPFEHGFGGRRFPVRVECQDVTAHPCVEAKRRLSASGIAASGASLGAAGTRGVIRVVVARWPAIKLVQAAATLERGPRRSGVFARFEDGGRALELLDPTGRAVRRAPAGSGLVAALSPAENEIVWVVTALDERGLEAAAGALDARTLRDAYALAVTPSGPEKLPLVARRAGAGA